MLDLPGVLLTVATAGFFPLLLGSVAFRNIPAFTENTKQFFNLPDGLEKPENISQQNQNVQKPKDKQQVQG